MSNVIQLKPRSRVPSLKMRYDPQNPYVVERQDWDDGTISYEVIDTRPETYRFVCARGDDYGRDPLAKWDMEQIARGLNLLVNLGKEVFPKTRNPHDDLEDE